MRRFDQILGIIFHVFIFPDRQPSYTLNWKSRILDQMKDDKSATEKYIYIE